MIAIPDYRITEKIYESDNTLVYRAYRDEDDFPVVLKILKEDYPTPEELTRYKREYEATCSLRLKGVVKALGFERYGNTVFIVFEDIGSTSFDRLLYENRFGLREFLLIAIKIVESLEEIHAHGIIHKDINPSNIIYNLDTGQLQIIDFGISTAMSNVYGATEKPGGVEGTLAYISPEQTGRMSRPVDHRTDFYALGATFYELLLRKPLFSSKDPVELIHCHMAKNPEPPHQVNGEIPKVISDIVMRLLEKNVEDRYRSASGIRADLQECLKRLDAHGSIQSFPIGINDATGRFRIPQKLYGREQELDVIEKAFERVNRGRSEMLLISGRAGVGKTTLVEEMYKSSSQFHSHFISGKFDQFKQNIPYSAVISAFHELIQQLLTENVQELEHWRKELQKTLGPNGQIIIDVIPEVKLIIGPQPRVPGLPPREAKNRFDLVFQSFITVLARQERPLVIFLDDLQWVDPASLKLIRLFMTTSKSRYMLLIGAYRDDEVSETHPLLSTIDEIRGAGTSVNHIFLTPLKLENVNKLISETLMSDQEVSLPLSELVVKKTNGNPFFIREFLESLYLKDLVSYDHEHNIWEWSMNRIQAQDITDNVVKMVAGRIQGLGKKTQDVLKLASCLGSSFEIEILAIVTEKSQKETVTLLREAVTAGLVFPSGVEHKSVEFDAPGLTERQNIEYKFSHDRVQQAANFLIPEEERENVHFEIGRRLLENSSVGLKRREIFRIVDHFNLSVKKFIHDQSKRDRLARLNLIAGRKAKSTAAYEAALEYFTQGVNLVSYQSNDETQKSSCWERKYKLALALYVEAAEAAYLCTEFDTTDEYAQVILEQAKEVLDKVTAYEVKIQASIARNRSQEGLKIGLAALRLLGVKFPVNPNRLDIMLALLRVKYVLLGKKIESLVDLPEMTDPVKLAAIRILMNLGTAAYNSAPNLFPLIVLKGIEFSVRYGNCLESTVAYASYGIILCAVLGDIEKGYRFGRQALKLLDRFNSKGLRARTLLMVDNFVMPWKESLRKVLPDYLVALESGLETGDFEWASYAAENYCSNALIIGEELGRLEKDFEKYSEIIRHFKQEVPLNCTKTNHQMILNLMGKSENPCLLVGDAYNERKMLPCHLKANDGGNLFALFFSKMMLCYIFQYFRQAAINAAETEKYLESATGDIFYLFFHFYDSLSQLAIFPETQRADRKGILKKVATNQKKMKKWAYHAPANYLNKFYLVEAERNRILGKETMAHELYDKAIQLAKKHAYIHEEALANELAARFFLEKSETRIAEKYMRNARYCYHRWGALAKVKALNARYPELLDRISPEAKEGVAEAVDADARVTVIGSEKRFDLITIMKVTRAISSEIVLPKLLDKLIRIIIENAGAGKGILILKSQGKLLIEAEGSVEDEKFKLLHSIPVDRAENIPVSIVNYVDRTQEYVVLNNPEKDNIFMNDAYVLKNKPKSILCGPLLYKSELIGILYIENSILPDAFSGERSEAIKLLGTQIAVSLENARLYKEMEAQAQEIKAININLSSEIEQRKKAEKELTKYRDHLEELVAQRTKELVKSRQALANLERDIEKRHRFQGIIGKSEKMQEIYALIEDLADMPATVLITGESGTGKELVAEALHLQGTRGEKPFVKVNCSALSETVLESELFGHVKGAFTGADRDRVGRFEKAGDGTIFLDEIGDISPYFQKRLLRVLQEREFEQVGSTKTKEMKARILAATNQNLLEKVRRGEFREDLYYRLRVVELHLPSLRERKEDIPLLLRYFLKHFSDELEKEIIDVSEDVLKQFMACPWPGNIRELKNTLEHICILCKSSIITIDDLPTDFLRDIKVETFREKRDTITPQAILSALEEAEWNRTRAARLLGISRRTLYRKLEEYGLMEEIEPR